MVDRLELQVQDQEKAFVTIAQRKADEARRRRLAADSVVADLRAFARCHGGRFVIFGSYVNRTMRYDSDLDVLIDFPADRAAEAWRFVETICAEVSLEPDIHEAGASTSAFVERVVKGGLVLS